jgi:hypothetical protein
LMDRLDGDPCRGRAHGNPAEAVDHFRDHRVEV